MAIEIERKFLVANEGWRAAVTRAIAMRQGYLARGGSASVRVRIAGDEAWVTVKSAAPGVARREFEYAIPRADAEELLAFCAPPVIEKVRHDVIWDGRLWTIDVFGGVHAGLAMAEIELADAAEAIEPPPWADREVTDDPAYRNENLG